MFLCPCSSVVERQFRNKLFKKKFDQKDRIVFESTVGRGFNPHQGLTFPHVRPR